MKRSENIEKRHKRRTGHLCIVLLTFLCMLHLRGNAQVYPIPDPNFSQFLMKNYPGVMDSSGKGLSIKNASQVRGNFDCSNQNIKDLSGIEYFINIRQLVCRQNQISYIPSLAKFLDTLVAFDCSDNLLSTLPELGSAGQHLVSLKCSNNQLTNLPGKTNFPLLDTLYCEGNYLTFKDLLPYDSVVNFTYAPQHPVPSGGRTEKQEGDTSVFFFPQDDSVYSNSYSFYKDGILIKSLGNSRVYIFQDIRASDAGSYTFQATNKALPALTLTTTPRELLVLNKNSDVFTPDGDNVNDSYYIPCSGVIRIYDRYGILVKEFQTSSYWDGTDLRGVTLPTGAYLIRCGHEKEFPVTIIR